MDAEFKWNLEKEEWLKRERNLSFEIVVEAAITGRIKDDLPHLGRARGNQRILIVEWDGRHIAVPYGQDGDIKFLKTMYFSRDFHARYGGSNGQTHH